MSRYLTLTTFILLLSFTTESFANTNCSSLTTKETCLGAIGRNYSCSWRQETSGVNGYNSNYQIGQCVKCDPLAGSNYRVIPSGTTEDKYNTCRSLMDTDISEAVRCFHNNGILTFSGFYCANTGLPLRNDFYQMIEDRGTTSGGSTSGETDNDLEVIEFTSQLYEFSVPGSTSGDTYLLAASYNFYKPNIVSGTDDVSILLKAKNSEVTIDGISTSVTGGSKYVIVGELNDINKSVGDINSPLAKRSFFQSTLTEIDTDNNETFSESLFQNL